MVGWRREEKKAEKRSVMRSTKSKSESSDCKKRGPPPATYGDTRSAKPLKNTRHQGGAEKVERAVIKAGQRKFAKFDRKDNAMEGEQVGCGNGRLTFRLRREVEERKGEKVIQNSARGGDG